MGMGKQSIINYTLGLDFSLVQVGVGVGVALIRSVSDIARGSSEARELRASSCRWVGGSLIAL